MLEAATGEFPDMNNLEHIESRFIPSVKTILKTCFLVQFLPIVLFVKIKKYEKQGEG